MAAVFAFVIEMPTLHRLACLRDDVIFIILIYQRWIYPVDKERYDEYSGGEERKELEALETVDRAERKKEE